MKENRYFTIAAAYHWPGKEDKAPSHSELAIRTLVKITKQRFGKENKTIRINYKRLRASAGRTMLQCISRRIQEAQVIIFDISSDKPNVFLELGIALARSFAGRDPSIYLIKEISDGASVTANLPSDLQGYFISGYEVKNGKVTFKDQNSLRMSIESDVKDFFNAAGASFETIDEIEG